jgi:putative oxidoreductase
MVSTGERRGRSALVALVWLLIVVEAVAMGGAGAAKFLAAETWDGLFATWGYPAGFSRFVGAIEIAAAIGLLLPRFSSYAGVVLIIVMVSALITVLLHPGSLGPVAPVVHMAVLVTIVVARWPRRAGGPVGSTPE